MIQYCAYNEERTCDTSCVALKIVDKTNTIFKGTPAEKTKKIYYIKCQRGNFLIEGEE